MMTMRIGKALLLICVFLVACSFPGSATDEAAVTPSGDLPIPPTATDPPVATQNVILFIVSEPAGDFPVDQVRDQFQALAGESGFTFEESQDLSAGAIDDSIRAVIVVGSVDGLDELVAGNPQVDFILAGDGGSSSQVDNLYLLPYASISSDQVAFLAGYAAAISTFDWRVGAVALNDAGGTLLLEAFNAGARYFCGWCRPVYPPYYEYPQTTSVSQADAAGGQTTAATMNDLGVETIFVPDSLATAEFLTPLAQAGLAIISTVNPVAGLEGQWMATIRFDSMQVVRDLWSAMLAGDPTPESTVMISLESINPDLISSGRVELVSQLADDLMSGFVITGAAGAE